MNIILCIISFLGLSVVLNDAFFLLKAKTEPSLLFCIKVCPLYCNSRSKRDVAPPEHYHFDTEEEPWQDVAEDIDWPSIPVGHYSPFFFCHPHPTTSTPKPTMPPMPTTTEEPTFICQLCKEKCNYPK